MRDQLQHLSRAKLIARFEMFLKGEWIGLIKASAVCATQVRRSSADRGNVRPSSHGVARFRFADVAPGDENLCNTGQLHNARGGTWGDTRILHEE